MKSSSSRIYSILWLTLTFAILARVQTVVLAEDQTPAKPTPPVATSSAESREKSLVPVASAAVAAPAESDGSPEDKSGTDASEDDKKAALENGAPVSPPVKPAAEEKRQRHLRTISLGDHRHRSDNARVSVFSDSTLAAGEDADAVVSVFGSSTSAGEVRDAVVSVLGSSTSSGNVGNAVVSVLGNTRVNGGTVGHAAVAVLGNNYVNGHVRGQVVAVFGNVELGPDAVVDGDLVCVGGELVRDPKAVVHGNVQNSFGGHHFAFDGFAAWVGQCLLYGRPLAFGAHLMWAWWIALIYLAVYLFLALIVPGAVTKCVQTLEERPGKSIVAGLLTLLLTPVVYVLMALTVFIIIGVALIPLFTLGLFFAGLLGKVVMLAWLGRRVTKLVAADAKVPLVLTVLLGGVMVLGLYTVPVLGFVVYKLLGILGLGVVIYTLLLSIKSGRPTPVLPVPMSAAAAAMVPPVGGEAAGVTPGLQLPPLISAATLPRAGFWIRVGASVLDAIMVAVLIALLHGVFGWFFKIGGSFPLWFAIYNVVMWATKGSTIGGIICGLKLVRLDDRPVEWGVAIVRALGAFLSFVVAGLGFIWVAFDDEKQSWHDKIAGTTIVRVPKGASLL